MEDVNMRFLQFYKLSFFITVLSVIIFIENGCKSDTKYELPESNYLSKPWTRWWWMGSSVTTIGITQHLEAFKENGLGGVEIVPIYGERGDEENFIPYLSDQWVEMLIYTLKEADRLDLGVDITLASGWPYGGPWISENHTARRYSKDFDDGVVTGQKVKRAAPGADGLVVDHFNPEAMQHFLSRFDSLMQIIQQQKLPLRSIFNDSYEVYGADWTTNFKDIFQKERGYSLNENIFNPTINVDSTESGRTWQDYHKTINDLVLETVGYTIQSWCEKYDLQYRYQAHGSPSNLLDLYSTATIPETESFGSSKFKIPNVQFDPDFDENNFSRPHPLIFKFASSPAHILGKPLISSETSTWLADHFKVSLSQVKPQIDELFTAGINHIFYHGISYSPFEKEFPGRLFYASTNFGPASALWNYLDNLNKYISNCQSILQHTTPDNDLLLYYPLYDTWDKKGVNGNIIMQSVHNPESWLYNTPFGEAAQSLYDAGFAFDYISDKQIELLVTRNIDNPDRYKALVIPNSITMPPETLNNLMQLKESGLEVCFLNDFPNNVPGNYNHSDRLSHLLETIKTGDFDKPISDDIDIISKTLEGYGIYPEIIKQHGLSFIRKSYDNGYIYFISNLGNNNINGYYPISKNYRTIEIYDPLSGKRGKAQTVEKGIESHVRLQINPGQSVFLITYDNEISLKPWKYILETYEDIELNEGWNISIQNELNEYPIDSLYTWTKLPYNWAPYFSGTARYTITFELNTKLSDSDAVVLDFGDLKYMATAWLNDTKIGEFFSVPFQTRIPAILFKSKNTLVIEVTNLDANRIIQLDREKIQWKNFYDINLVDIKYFPFDASGWDPVPSGLLGPVRLIPVSLN